MQKIKWLCAVYFEQQTCASNVVYGQNYIFQGFNIFLDKTKKKVTKDVNFNFNIKKVLPAFTCYT